MSGRTSDFLKEGIRLGEGDNAIRQGIENAIGVSANTPAPSIRPDAPSP